MPITPSTPITGRLAIGAQPKTAGAAFSISSAAGARRRLALAAAVMLPLLGACSHGGPTNETAPATYRVNFDTSKGAFVIEVTRDLAPNGADRFYNLVKADYFDGARFFRVIGPHDGKPGFVVQWGIAADPAVTKKWDVTIPDDPVKTRNERGTITFAAASSPNTRSTQVFINYADNSRLDHMGFAPFGKVISGMDVVDQIYSGYGEGPDQQMAEQQGNAYLEKNFPQLDYIRTARIAQ